MYAKKMLIRALDCIAEEGYVSKDNALIKDTQSTAQRVLSSLEIAPDLSDAEDQKYGHQADSIIDWVLNADHGGNEYLGNCKTAVQDADLRPQKVAGYVVSLVQAFERYQQTSKGLDLVVHQNAFAADPGLMYTGTGKVINVQSYDTYAKISMVDSNGYLVTCSANKSTKKGLTIPKIGDNITLSGRVYRNKFSTPFETVLSRPTLEII